jgi:hypothetical protein
MIKYSRKLLTNDILKYKRVEMRNNKRFQYFIEFVYLFIFFIGVFSIANAQQLVWERIFDTGYGDFSTGISIDSDNNIIIAGFNGYQNGLIVKYNTEGDTLWSCINDVPPSAVACDNEKNIIVLGTIFIEDSTRVCILKYDPEGNLLWRQQTKGILIMKTSNIRLILIQSQDLAVLRDEIDWKISDELDI